MVAGAAEIVSSSAANSGGICGCAKGWLGLRAAPVDPGASIIARGMVGAMGWLLAQGRALG